VRVGGDPNNKLVVVVVVRVYSHITLGQTGFMTYTLGHRRRGPTGMWYKWLPAIVIVVILKSYSRSRSRSRRRRRRVPDIACSEAKLLTRQIHPSARYLIRSRFHKIEIK